MWHWRMRGGERGGEPHESDYSALATLGGMILWVLLRFDCASIEGEKEGIKKEGKYI